MVFVGRSDSIIALALHPHVGQSFKPEQSCVNLAIRPFEVRDTQFVLEPGALSALTRHSIGFEEDLEGLSQRLGKLGQNLRPPIGQ